MCTKRCTPLVLNVFQLEIFTTNIEKSINYTNIKFTTTTHPHRLGNKMSNGNVYKVFHHIDKICVYLVTSVMWMNNVLVRFCTLNPQKGA